MTTKRIRRPGRLVEKPMPDLIPDIPENIALVNTPPKREDDWDYLNVTKD